MIYSPALKRAALKYYSYSDRLSRTRTSSMKPFLSAKAEQYRIITSELFRKEYAEWQKTR